MNLNFSWTYLHKTIIRCLNEGKNVKVFSKTTNTCDLCAKVVVVVVVVGVIAVVIIISNLYFN